MLLPVRRGSLRAQLTQTLFEAILHGELQPGERIIEGRLARQLGVAQSTLREALQELEHQGLVTKSDRRGSYVTKLTVGDMEDIYVVRLGLEPLAASLACERMAEGDFEALDRILNSMQEATARRDFVELLKQDLAFHQLIWKLSANAPIEKALNAVCPPLFASYMMRVVAGDFYDFTRDHAEHAALIETLKQGGKEAVYAAFRSMVGVFREQDVENLRDYYAKYEDPEFAARNIAVSTK